LTGIGGGIARDVLAAEIPTVLRADLYAVAALIGAAVVVIGHVLLFPASLTAVVGVLACFSIRVIAIRRGWHLPIASEAGQAANDATRASRENGDAKIR
jgi:uncharacterized membrane protein YeiH